MRKITEYLILSAGLALNCWCQSLNDQINFRTGDLAGAHLYGVSVFSGYSTSVYPVGQSIQAGASTIGGDATYGASASMGWQRHREWMSFSVVYSPSFVGEAHYSNLNSLNHSLLINASRTFGKRWSLSLSGSGQDMSLTQFLFNPTSFAVQSQAPISFNDLAASFALGQFTNSQVASMLTGAYPPQSPTQNLLYGYRTLSYSTQATLVYTYSPRLSFQVSSFAAGTQPLNNSSQIYTTNLVNHTIGAHGGGTLSYSLTPRTQIGLTLDETWQINHYQNAYISTASASIGRKMGEHWFLNGKGGYAYTHITKGGLLPSSQVIGGGSLGFKTYQHTLTASYTRTSTDAYGIIGTVNIAGGSWRWHHPGSDWALTTDFSQQQTRNTGFVNLSGWDASGGITRKISDQSMASAQYVYFSGSSSFSGNLTTLRVQSVRLSVEWSPQPVR